jgi:hypothetical protein
LDIFHLRTDRSSRALQINPLAALAQSGGVAFNRNRENALRVLHIDQDRGLRICSALRPRRWVGGPVSRTWTVIFAFVGVLFNPILPIYLKWTTWFGFDIGAAAHFTAHLAFVRLLSVREVGGGPP